MSKDFRGDKIYISVQQVTVNQQQPQMQLTTQHSLTTLIIHRLDIMNKLLLFCLAQQTLFIKTILISQRRTCVSCNYTDEENYDVDSAQQLSRTDRTRT